MWSSLSSGGPHGPLGVLSRSSQFRSKSSHLSARVDRALDTYWNRLEDNAKVKVDERLMEMGLIVKAEEVEEEMTYLQMLWEP